MPGRKKSPAEPIPYSPGSLVSIFTILQPAFVRVWIVRIFVIFRGGRPRRAAISWAVKNRSPIGENVAPASAIDFK